MKKKDLWELEENISERGGCDNCKWENEAYEEEINDGYAPCHRCSRHKGD